MTQKERVAGIRNTIIANLEKAEKGKKIVYLYVKADYTATAIIDTVKAILADEGKTVECSTKEITPSSLALIFTIKK